MSNRPQRPNPYSSVAPQALGRPDRNQASTAAPQVDSGQGERQSDIFTLITQVGVPLGASTPPILYNGDRTWALVTLTLETAGIVVVGTRADLTPILSGKGQSLIQNVPKEFKVAKGTRLYYLASAVNRVTVAIEPIPWLEQIAALANAIARK